MLLHRKSWYEPGIYRLLTGGIDNDEEIEDALFRELEEETGLTGGDAQFLGVLDARITYQSKEVTFTSFIFYLKNLIGTPEIPNDTEDISDFKDVAIYDLLKIANQLRNTPPPREGWGEWRAIAHEFVHEKLSQ